MKLRLHTWRRCSKQTAYQTDIGEAAHEQDNPEYQTQEAAPGCRKQLEI